MAHRLRPLPFRWPIAFGVAAVLSAFTIFQAYIPYTFGEEEFPFYYRGVPTITSNILWALLCPLIYALVHRVSSGRTRTIRTLKQLGLAVGVSVAHRFVAESVFLSRYYFEEPSGFAEFLHHTYPRYFVGFVGSFVEFWILVGAFYAFDFYRQYKDGQLELALMEQQLSNAQLNALKMQLHPHFLFNTLHTVSSLMDQNVREARDVLARLGSLLRSMLDSDQQHTVALSKELESIRDYLEIEQSRFRDRLRIEYDVSDDTLTAVVPNLILQPLVENAIKHGFSKRTDCGTIRVSSRWTDTHLELEIGDDGHGMEDTSVALEQPGIGIRNVQERLRQLYPDGYRFELESPPGGGFVSRVAIPREAATSTSEIGS